MAHRLIIADIHEPFCHPDYFDFVCRVRDQWQCDEWHFTGDIVDSYAQSTYKKDPRSYSANHEGDLACERVQQWHREFPKATVCIGNHDRRPSLRAEEGGLDPSRHLKSYAEAWETPSWRWVTDCVLDGVYYTHGDGRGSGEKIAIDMARLLGQSVVIGHFHSQASVLHGVQAGNVIFGMTCGCGLDPNTYASAYAKSLRHPPILSCGVVLDGEYATIETMRI